MIVIVALKYDVSDVESGGGGEEPQPASYPGTIVQMTHRTKRNDGTKISDLEIICSIGSQYVRLWTYVKLPDDPNWSKESHGWKLRELTDALGLPPKGSVDPVKVTKQQPAVLVKVTSDTHRDTGEYRGKIKNLFPIGDNEAPASESSDGGTTEGPYDEAEIESWDDQDIRDYAGEIGVEDITGRGWRSKLIAAILEAQESSDTSDDGAEAESGGDYPADIAAELNEDTAYYADWSDDDIKWMLEGLGIDGNVATSGRGWKTKAVAAIVEIAAGSSNGAEPEAEAEVEDDMEDLNADDTPVWSDQDLKDEIATRNEQGAEIKLAGRWSRAKAIEALREDNKLAAEQPF